MFSSLVELTKTSAKIITAPVAIAAEIANAALTPVAEIAEDVKDLFTGTNK